MLRGVRFKDEDFHKPIITIAAPYTNATPCNDHLNVLSEYLVKAIEARGGKAFVFGTPVISDGTVMGMEGMKYSLPSRDLIADSIEMMHEGYHADGIITLSGCDKTIPAALMPIARTNAIGLTLYGGSIRAGKLEGKDVNIVSSYEAVGSFSSNNISLEQLKKVECSSCPGVGSCGGMYTANTMATCIEAMGMSIPGSSSNVAANPTSTSISSEKFRDCDNTVDSLFSMLRNKVTARQIMTMKAFENAMTVVLATGGSTNAVLHLLAIAKDAGVPLVIEDFNRIANRVPMITNLKPGGEYLMEDLYRLGGLPVLMKELLNAGLLHGDCITVTGKTVAENLKNVGGIPANQNVLRPVSAPFAKPNNHLLVLRGNIAPEGCVIKLSGKDIPEHRGPARVFETEEPALDAIMAGKIKPGDVIVIRNEGPVGGPGMREMLSVSSALVGAGMGKTVALITDGRFSGGSHGIMIGHISPEAQLGGPIGLVKEGDIIRINPYQYSIQLEVADAELAERKKSWKPKPSKYTRGVLAKYAKLVSTAAFGAVTS
jgi:dihydroxy-acid dehydratase